MTHDDATDWASVVIFGLFLVFTFAMSWLLIR